MKFPSRERPGPIGAVLVPLLFLVACPSAFEAPLTPEDRGWASEDLTAVAIVDRDADASNEAIVASLAGSIYRTVDAGETFRRAHANGGASLFDLSMADRSHGWAVGAGTILVTRNGGRSWRAQVLPNGQETASLRAVHAIDRLSAIAVGLQGVRLRTENGGRTWIDRTDSLRARASHERRDPVSSESPTYHRVTFDADLFGLACAPLPVEICVSFGSAGGTAFSRDRGASWVAAEWTPALPLEPIAMREGGVDFAAGAAEQASERAAHFIDLDHVSIRIEAVATPAEIQTIGRERDPSTLFEILETRALDMRGAFEASGIAPDRIQVRGTPPWGYAEFLDDDPDYLERYWRSRRSSVPGVRVVAIDERPLRAGVVRGQRASDAEPGEVQRLDAVELVAVGGGGAVWRGQGGGQRMGPGERVAEADLRAIARGHGDLIAVGSEGLILTSVDEGRTWRRVPPAQGSESSLDLLDVDGGGHQTAGWIVGVSGIVLRKNASSGLWRRLRVEDF